MQHNFYFSSHVLLLFKEWQVDSVGVLVGAFIGVFVFTFLYEIASFYQSRNADRRPGPSGRVISSEEHENAYAETSENEEPFQYGTFGSHHGTSVTAPYSESNRNRTIPLHTRVKIAFRQRYILSSVALPFLLAANYFIMLAVMTYNGWLFIAVCLASGLGYFLLHPDKDVPPVKSDNHGRWGYGGTWTRLPLAGTII